MSFQKKYMCKAIGKVYIPKMEVPKAVRIVSKKLGLDHVVINDSNLNISDYITYDDLVKLSETNLFEYVAFTPYENSIYCLQPEGAVSESERKFFLHENDWFLVKECEFVQTEY